MEISMTTDHTAFKPMSRAISQSPKKRPSRTLWIKILAEFSKSGLSVKQFCRLKRLSPSNFYTWRKRLREEDIRPPAPATFIPLAVRPTAPFPDLSKDRTHNQQAPFALDAKRGGDNSGLSIHLNESIKISVDKNFHEPTLQRLVQLFSCKESATC
jgi:transposase-like protein